jgi:hypothetical protein
MIIFINNFSGLLRHFIPRNGETGVLIQPLFILPSLRGLNFGSEWLRQYAAI